MSQRLDTTHSTVPLGTGIRIAAPFRSSGVTGSSHLTARPAIAPATEIGITAALGTTGSAHPARNRRPTSSRQRSTRACAAGIIGVAATFGATCCG